MAKQTPEEIRERIGLVQKRLDYQRARVVRLAAVLESTPKLLYSAALAVPGVIWKGLGFGILVVALAVTLYFTAYYLRGVRHAECEKEILSMERALADLERQLA